MKHNDVRLCTVITHYSQHFCPKGDYKNGQITYFYLSLFLQMSVSGKTSVSTPPNGKGILISYPRSDDEKEEEWKKCH